MPIYYKKKKGTKRKLTNKLKSPMTDAQSAHSNYIKDAGSGTGGSGDVPNSFIPAPNGISKGEKKLHQKPKGKKGKTLGSGVGSGSVARKR